MKHTGSRKTVALGMVVAVGLVLAACGSSETGETGATPAASEVTTPATATDASTAADITEISTAASTTEMSTEAEENATSAGESMTENTTVESGDAADGVVKLGPDHTQAVVGSADAEAEVSYQKIRFTLPKGWMGATVPDQNNCYFFYAANARCMLNSRPLDGADLTSDSGIQGAVQGIEEGGFKQAALVETFPVGDAKAFVFTGTSDTGGSVLQGTVIYVQVGDEIYSFILAAEEGSGYDADIEALKKSIRLN